MLVQKLSGIKLIYCATAQVSYHFVVQLVQIVGHGIEQNLGKNIRISSAEESPKPVILLQYAKRAFDLDRTIEP